MLFVKSQTKNSLPVLFYHGLFGSHHDGLNFFSSSYLSWHLLDLPGHGKTPPPFSFDLLHKYLDALEQPFHLVGYSLGGRIAQKLAHHPRCKSLTLISSQTLFDEAELEIKKKQERILIEKLQNTPFDTFLHQWYNAPLFTSLRHRERLYEKVLERRKQTHHPKLLEALMELRIEHLLSSLPSCPILGLYGMLDAKYQRLYTKLPEAIQVVAIPRAGHALHLENPSSCLQTIETFISQIQ